MHCGVSPSVHVSMMTLVRGDTAAAPHDGFLSARAKTIRNSSLVWAANVRTTLNISSSSSVTDSRAVNGTSWNFTLLRVDMKSLGRLSARIIVDGDGWFDLKRKALIHIICRSSEELISLRIISPCYQKSEVNQCRGRGFPQSTVSPSYTRCSIHYSTPAAPRGERGPGAMARVITLSTLELSTNLREVFIVLGQGTRAFSLVESAFTNKNLFRQYAPSFMILADRLSCLLVIPCLIKRV